MENNATCILEWNFDFNEDFDNEEDEIYESFKLFSKNNKEIVEKVKYVAF